MKTEVRNNYNVMRLQQWLDYELSAAELILLAWFWNLTFPISIITEILFTPFMLNILLDEKSFGWITFFHDNSHYADYQFFHQGY